MSSQQEAKKEKERRKLAFLFFVLAGICWFTWVFSPLPWLAGFIPYLIFLTAAEFFWITASQMRSRRESRELNYAIELAMESFMSMHFGPQSPIYQTWWKCEHELWWQKPGTRREVRAQFGLAP